MEKYSAGRKNSRRPGNPVKKSRAASLAVPVKEKGKRAGKQSDPDLNLVHEEAAAYAPDIFTINPAGTPVTGLSSFQKMKMSERGVAKRELEKLKERTSLNYDQLAGLLLVTKATLINKARSSRFNSSISEKIIGIWEIYVYGAEVFADESLFREWLFRRNQALGGKMPFEFLHNSFGREEIRNLLGRIEYGVYS